MMHAALAIAGIARPASAAAALAQASRLERLQALRQAFSEPREDTMPGFAWGFLVAFGAILLLVIGVRTWQFIIERADPRSSPMALFRWALRRRGVRALDRLILCRLAQRRVSSRELEHPTAMLLSVRIYERERAGWRTALSPGVLQRWLERRLVRIGRQLFDPPASPA